MDYDEGLVEYILEKASELKHDYEQKENISIWTLRDEESFKRLSVLFNSLSEMFSGTSTNVVCGEHVTNVYDSYVMVEGSTVEFSDIKEFLYLASVSDGIQIDVTADGMVRVFFYVKDIARREF